MDFLTIFLILFSVLLILSGLFVVKQQTSAIIERFGKFIAVRQAGLHIKIPLIDKISGRISLRVLQLDVIVETTPLGNPRHIRSRFQLFSLRWISLQTMQ